ncbi:MAG: hypothetical protein ACOYEV_02840 [Candidatus Nanopelagicales bacterium]
MALIRIAKYLAQSARLRLARNVRDAAKCVVLGAKVGLALRASLENRADGPWDEWLAFADNITQPAGEVQPSLPDPGDFPAQWEELLAVATTPIDNTRQACGRSRDAAALAALAVLDELAESEDTTALAAAATQLARASLAWLALTERLGVPRAQSADQVMTGWLEEGTRWLPSASDPHFA